MANFPYELGWNEPDAAHSKALTHATVTALYKRFEHMIANAECAINSLGQSVMLTYLLGAYQEDGTIGEVSDFDNEFRVYCVATFSLRGQNENSYVQFTHRIYAGHTPLFNCTGTGHHNIPTYTGDQSNQIDKRVAFVMNLFDCQYTEKDLGIINAALEDAIPKANLTTAYDLLVKAREINKNWLLYHKGYIDLAFTSDEYMDTYRYRLWDTDPNSALVAGSPAHTNAKGDRIYATLVSQYLDPTAADGHTYHLFLDAFQKALKRGSRNNNQ